VVVVVVVCKAPVQPALEEALHVTVAQLVHKVILIQVILLVVTQVLTPAAGAVALAKVSI
jgi:hypothetical protein